MLSEIKFSVIMPSYKLDTSYPRRAIESVLAQIYTNWELIYVDDNPAGSPYKDASRCLLAEHAADQRIRSIFHEDNMGANRARNDAIAASKGEWLAFLDADDYWEPNYLQLVSQKINDKNCALVSTAMVYENGTDSKIVPRDHPDGMIYEEAIFENIFGGSSCVCIRKDALSAIGGFDELLPACQDFDVFLRICKTEPVAFCNVPAVHYSNDEHERISSSYKRREAGRLAVLDKVMADADLSEDLKRAVANSYYRVLARMYIYEAGNGREARRLLSRCSNDPALKMRMMSYIAPLVCRARRIMHLWRGRRSGLEESNDVSNV